MIRTTTVQRRLFSLVSAILLTMLLPVAQQVLHADGTLDPSFGQGGTVTTSFDNARAAALDMAIQPDGKIVVLGAVFGNGQLALARYNTDGSLDATFGVNGRVVTTFATASFAVPHAMAFQADGKIVVAGLIFEQGHGDTDMFVARFNPNGAIDSGFGTQGLATVDLGDADGANAVVVQHNGKIIIGGATGTDTTSIGIARLNANGSLDTSFADNGMTVVNLFGGIEEVRALALQADDKLVVGSYTAQTNGVTDFMILRYTADGELDADHFGIDGIVTTDLGHDDRVTDIAIQADGKIVAVGTANNDARHIEDFGVARYNTDGSLDAAFGNGGFVVTDLGSNIEQPNAVAIQADGKIVVAGTGNGSTMGVLVRYNTDGSKDSPFGTDGVVRVATPVAFAAVAIQSDAKIVAAGGGPAWSVDRFLASTSPVTQP